MKHEVSSRELNPCEYIEAMHFMKKNNGTVIFPIQPHLFDPLYLDGNLPTTSLAVFFKLRWG